MKNVTLKNTIIWSVQTRIFIFSVYYIRSLSALSVISVLQPPVYGSFGLHSRMGLLKSSAFTGLLFSVLLLFGLLLPVFVDADDLTLFYSVTLSMRTWRDLSISISFFIQGCSLIYSKLGRSLPFGLNILIIRSLNSHDTAVTPTFFQYCSSDPYIMS